MNLIDILIEPIIRGSYDIIGMSIFGSNRKSTYYAAKKIKKIIPKVKLLFGGPSTEHIFWLNGEPGPALKFWLDDNDVAIIGEAEKSLPDLIKWWGNPNGFLPKGVVFNHMGIPKYTPAFMSNFSESITPDYIDFDAQIYTQGEIPIEISRGCIGNCVFCTEKNIHHGYRTRSVNNLINIFKNGVNNKNIRKYSFVGSAINGNHKHFIELIYKIIESGLDIEWDTSIRFDRRLNKNIIQDMA